MEYSLHKLWVAIVKPTYDLKFSACLRRDRPVLFGKIAEIND